VYLAEKKFTTTPRAFSLHRVTQYRSVDRYYFVINTDVSYLSRFIRSSLDARCSFEFGAGSITAVSLASREARAVREQTEEKKERRLDLRM
jgi:hypothetical protein